MKPFKDYKRKFIQLRSDVLVLLHIFEKDVDHSFEDMSLEDHEEVWKMDRTLYKESAKQFIDQLEGHWCVAFLEALRDECIERIELDRKRVELVKEKIKDENL
jgi:hypothetical protein